MIKGSVKTSKAAYLVILLLLSLSTLTSKAQQQSFSFTQYMDNLTPLNPAYSLIDNVASVNSMARKQWVGIDGAPTTLLVNANLPFQSIFASAGIVALNDVFAIEHETEVNAYFAKAIQVGENHYLAVSLNAGFRNYVANYSSLDSDDPTFRNDIRQTRPNVGFGVLYFSDWYYVGFSLPELTINSLGTASIQGNSNFRNHYYASGACLFNIDEDIKFKPATLLSIANGVPFTADISGTFYLKDEVGLGVNYRTNKEAAGIITVNLNGFHVGYSYQFGTSSSNLGGFNVATHEVTLGYRFGKGSGIAKVL